jgi:hypothetical protein
MRCCITDAVQHLINGSLSGTGMVNPDQLDGLFDNYYTTWHTRTNQIVDDEMKTRINTIGARNTAYAIGNSRYIQRISAGLAGKTTNTNWFDSVGPTSEHSNTCLRFSILGDF